ncbi:PD-(D/E)XK nuclease family protein [Trueperella sp. LYQ143]|uniref:PD-(D/E)XK nuclease family protein n=1 Tax=unclassified Trueperella TaxID=2630174 RepID=UPI003983A32B
MSDDVIFDPSQQAVLDLVAPEVACVVGAPGTGKSLLARELAVRLCKSDPHVRIAVLTPGRREADVARNAMTARLGYLPNTVNVQSISAFAFRIVCAYAARLGRNIPQLLSGSEQDRMIHEALEFLAAEYAEYKERQGAKEDPRQAEEGLESMPFSPQAMTLDAVRAEFRELLTRSAELGLDGSALAELGRQYDEPMWRWGARLIDVYEKSLATQASMGNHNPDMVDHSRLVSRAAAAIDNWDSADQGATVIQPIVRPHWDWVIIDDVHNATLALRTLLRSLREDGSNIVAFGDPDCAVNGFRGGIAQLPAILTRSPATGGIGARLMILERRYRNAPEITELIMKITAGIHVAGVGRHRGAVGPRASEGNGTTGDRAQRGELPVEENAQLDLAQGAQRSGNPQNAEGCVLPENNAEKCLSVDESQKAAQDTNGDLAPFDGVHSALFANSSDEMSYVANYFQRLHAHGVPYSQMAVIARSNSSFAVIQRQLRQHGVPVRSVGLTGSLSQHPAVLAVVELIRLALCSAQEAHSDSIRRVLTGPLIGIDPMELRRFFRLLHAIGEQAGTPYSDEELWRAILLGDPIVTQIAQLERFAQILERIRHAAQRRVDAQQLLWEAWDSVGVAEQWRECALAGREGAEEAHSNLDAIIALFRVAQRLVDRYGVNADFRLLDEHVFSNDVPEDSIARTRGQRDEVSLVTPSSAIGKQWDYVAVVGIAEGQWPNMRLRNVMTHVPQLVNIVVGHALSGSAGEAQQYLRDVLDDELRMLLQAVSRARRGIMLTSEDSPQAQASRFFTEFFPDAQRIGSFHTSYSLMGLLGELHRATRCADEQMAQEATAIAQRLADDGIWQADPSRWVDRWQWTSQAHDDTTVMSVSPSRLADIRQCPLKAFFDQAGMRQQGQRLHIEIGKILHVLAEEYAQGTDESYAQRARELLDTLPRSTNIGEIAKLRDVEKMVDHLKEYLDAQAEHVDRVSVEQPARYDMNTAAGPVRLSGRLDRIEYCDNDVNIVDFKTGRSPRDSRDPQRNMQLRSYQFFAYVGAIAHAAKGMQASAELVNVNTSHTKGKKARIESFSKSDAEQMVTACEFVRREFSAQSISARASDECSRCPFAHVCPSVGNGRLFS